RRHGGGRRRRDRTRLAGSARRRLGARRRRTGCAGQPRPGRAAGAVGADRGGRAGRARARWGAARAHLQSGARRAAGDQSRRAAAADGAHPAANRGGKGLSAVVVLMAYGSPERLEDVPAYYADIRGGRPIEPEHLEDLVERYRRLGLPSIPDEPFSKEGARGGTM